MSKRVIAVNTRFLIKDKLEGIGWFTFETLKRITRSHPDHEFHFFFDRPYDPSFIFSDNIVPHVLQPPARHPFLWYIWFEWSVKRMLKKIKADAFISTDGQMCLSTEVPTLLVIHDLAFEHYPEFVNGIASRYYRYFTPKYARKAKQIATVSSFSKQDIISCYGIDADKIDVVYNGCNEMYTPLEMADQVKVRAQYANGQDYFLYVGSIHPRKNIKNLFLAFDAFKSATKDSSKLIIAGRKAWMFTEIEQAYEQMKFKEDVVFVGHLLPEDLHRLIASAFALAYPSVFEGFGIPILEAINCNVPVITSSVSSMPEVAGDAGILVDPFQVGEIASAMQKLRQDPELRAKLIESGRFQAKKFTWDKSASALWTSLLKVLP